MESCGTTSKLPGLNSFMTASSDGPAGSAIGAAGAVACGAAAGAGAAGADAAGALAPPEATAASMSLFTTRPCGPEPETAESAIPASLARRRASGEANTRSPASCPFEAAEPAAAPPPTALRAATSPARGEGCVAVLGDEGPSEDFDAPPPPSRGRVGEGGLAGADAAGLSAPAAAPFPPPAVSPSARSVAIGWLTGTSAVPSATRISPTVPSSTASTSIVALSVSISATTSPDDTLSPGLTCHLARLPFSIVGESAGIRISIGTVRRSPS